MRYLSSLLCVIGAFGQANPIVDYLKLTPQQVAALSSNIRDFGPAVRVAVSKENSWYNAIKAEYARDELDSAALGSLQGQIEMNCREIAAAASQISGQNRSLLTSIQRVRLDALLALSNDEWLFDQATMAHLSTTPILDQNAYSAYDPSLELALVIGLTQTQLARLRTLNQILHTELSSQYDRIFALRGLMDAELLGENPSPSVLGGAGTELARRFQQIAGLVAQSVKENRAVLSAEQRAKIDSLFPAAKIDSLISSAATFYLRTPEALLPASLSFFVESLGGLVLVPEYRYCPFPSTHIATAARL